MIKPSIRTQFSVSLLPFCAMLTTMQPLIKSESHNMIGCLIGEVFALEAPTVLLNVNGVGYEIDTPLTTFCQLQKGQNITLWTHLAVREDAQLLYGFLHQQEKIIFRTLLKVNGVGPKMALGILSTLSVDMLIHTVEHEDINTLVKVPGVGKKTAERLMIELRDRFKAMS